MRSPGSPPPQSELAVDDPPQTCSPDELVSAWTCIARSYTQVTQMLTEQVERETGLPAASFFALVRLHQGGSEGVPLTTLARHLAFSSGGFTKVADRLEQAGLIKRHPSQCDRRVTNAALTPAGRAQAERALGVYSAGLRELVFQRLGLSGLHCLADHMSRLGCGVPPGD
jgi:DNA-binding MarR family transcriptional regulator